MHVRDPAPSRPLKLPEAARLLGVDRQTLIRNFERGQVPGRKIGGRYYFPPDLLTRLGLVPMDGPHPPAEDEGPAA